MSYNKLCKIILPFLLSAIIVSVISIPTNFNGNPNTIIALHVSGPKPVTNASLMISNDSGFITYGFPGNGSAENPYRIENYSLVFTFNSTTAGILIENVTKHFIIRNLTLTNNNTELLGTGIRILADNGVIENVTIENTLNGIHLEGNNLQVNYTAINSQQFGLWSKECTNLNITSNNITGAAYGVYLLSCNKTIISDNIIFNGNNGIQIYGSTNFEIKHNIISQNSEKGLFIVETPPKKGEINLVIRNWFFQNEMQALVITDDINTIFYDVTSQEGNYWSDWRGWGNYKIQTDVYDIYPLDQNLELATRYPFKFWFWIFAPIIIALGAVTYFFYWKLIIQPTKE
ncbi:MAG: right-handed parallel beta-helix repeat-containing protein [Candidatus Lokiarchaeota archaeon]|nr:right-handed parallel beta-helix repeat-containing protein [Candidatus Lokiarchaeota archaeon]